MMLLARDVVIISSNKCWGTDPETRLLGSIRMIRYHILTNSYRYVSYLSVVKPGSEFIHASLGDIIA